MIKLMLPNLHQTDVNTFLSINISNSNDLNKFSTRVPTKPNTLGVRTTRKINAHLNGTYLIYFDGNICQGFKHENSRVPMETTAW